ncbi:MAG: nucleoside triphosphate pyrophosphohydrolase [Alphaproteobacteria bacterium]|nr:MAG: nucleoside triphosphate pyrophosphohydrolase [Alphaproteobacteria bacterium]
MTESAKPAPLRATDGILRVIEIMARLRDPETGCPWDLKQDFRSMTKHVIEEAYEVAEAADSGDTDHLREELGDLLLQVIFYAQLAEEKGIFDINSIANGLADKLISRHPHVFGDEQAATADDVMRIWSARKEAEKAQKLTAPNDKPDYIISVPASLPAMLRTTKLQEKKNKTGWDWATGQDALNNIKDEIAEARAELNDENPGALYQELGDVLFSVVATTRFLGFDPEAVLRACNHKFEGRIWGIEDILHAQGRRIENTSAQEIQDLWIEIKQHRKNGEFLTPRSPREDYFLNIPAALPAIRRTSQMEEKKNAMGWDWVSSDSALQKILDELEEAVVELDINNRTALADEMGDVIFASIACIRYIGYDPEEVLNAANDKFERRFHVIEDRLHQEGRRLHQASASEIQDLWVAAKRQEKLSAPVDKSAITAPRTMNGTFTRESLDLPIYAVANS